MTITLTLDEDFEKRLAAAGVENAEAFARNAVQAALNELAEDRSWAEQADLRKQAEHEERIWSLEELERGNDLAG